MAPVTTARRARIMNTKGKTASIRDEDQQAQTQKWCQHLRAVARAPSASQMPDKMETAALQLANWSENFQTMALPDDGIVSFWRLGVKFCIPRGVLSEGKRCFRRNEKDSTLNLSDSQNIFGNKHVKAEFFSLLEGT